MKPSFALDLRFSAVTLLHRTALGWTKLGEVALDAPDLVETLAVMRATALGLSPRGITTKVILPNSQILYTTVTSPVAEPWTRTRRIGAALEGLTPYPLDELAFDWCEAEAGLQVAVLAKETLEEAETFARNHRFNPVSFVAVPDDGTFAGEPFFGTSTLSQSLLAKDETVERDAEPVRVVGRDGPAPTSVIAEPVVAAPKAPEPAAPEPVALDPVAHPISPQQAATPQTGLAENSDPQATPPAPAPQGDAPSPPAAIIAQPRPVVAEQGVGDAVAPISANPVADAPVAAPPAVPSDLASVAAARPAPIPTTAPPPKAEAPEAPMALDVDAEDTAEPSPKIASPVATPVPKPAPPRDDRLRAFGPASPQRAPVPRPVVAKPLAGPSAVDRPKGARPWQAGSAKDKARDAATLAKTRATRDRVAGAANSTAAQQRRYIILILSAVLVLLLAIVVIWSALRLGTNEAKNRATSPALSVAQNATPAGSAVSPSAAAENGATELPSTLDEAAADGQSTDGQIADGQSTNGPDPSLAQTAPIEPAPKTEVAAANVVAAAPDTSGQDEIFLASADTPPLSLDPIALPAPEVGADTDPVVPTDPPPYIEPYVPQTPTAAPPEGVFPPAGVLMTAARPPLRPLARPQALIFAPPSEPIAPLPSAAPLPEVPLPEVAVPEVAVQDPSLAGKRPHPRPADLVQVVATPSASDSLAPDARYAKLRPQPRPANLSSSPSDGVVLTSSPKPQARPADLGSGIDDAVSVALNQQPEADQPQAEAPAPTMPTNASVAKQATDRNALKANRVVLLAVFGTPSSRFAMIRLANGRVKKVKVGDMIDGGRIAGITADSVQYQKGSRVVTLSLPQG